MAVDTSQGDLDEVGPVIDLRVEFSVADDGESIVTARRGEDTAAAEVTLPDTAIVVARLATRDASAAHLPSPSQPVRDLEAVGRQLFEAVFKDGVRELYELALRDSAEAGTRVRITLDFKSAPHLLGIPWELLNDDPLFIATQPDITVVREVNTTRRSEPLLVAGTVRILGITCSPSDMDALDVDAERKRVETELEELTRTGLAEISWLDPPTADALQEALRGGFHVLHYVGHSRGPGATEAALILEKPDRTSHALTGLVLANMIGKGTTLRLALLNSCESATAIAGDPFSAIATRLISVGIPAVVAMQIPVLDDAAVTFGGEFYRGLLLEEARIEEAVASGRLALLRSGYDIDWLAPVLFVDAPDTDLLDLSLVGWYTLNGTEPLRRPTSEGRITYGAGFLGLSVFDNVSRALALLGPDANTRHDDGQTHRLWRFQNAANVAVTSRDDLITSLSLHIDADDPGDLRLWLPGGLLLGRATLADSVDAMKVLHREYAARINNMAADAVDVGSIEPRVTRTKPENFLIERWRYIFPSPEGGITASFGTSTAAGRWRERPAWFSFDMDLQDRIISSCEFAIREPGDLVSGGGAEGHRRPDTPQNRDDHADADRTAEDRRRAIQQLEQTLAYQETILGADHPDTLASRSNLAAAYGETGDLATAIALEEQTLADRERILGSHHPDTYVNRNNLATAYQSAGNFERATPLLQKNLADMEHALGPSHPHTMTGRHNLAYTYLVSGNEEEAIALFEQNLADRERVLGPDHPDTLSSRTMLEKGRDYVAALKAEEES